ncbi:hypothetical protein C4F50_14360 [Flavobacterium sp. KB82]|uniref:Uncharacterized protein n=1 Tax=Flavobacterium hungaricum TaxID=2082725 RepID=A0ABR9TM81_9FLAO|nr:hypothetical protein [Flavobacterium hungaricum]
MKDKKIIEKKLIISFYFLFVEWFCLSKICKILLRQVNCILAVAVMRQHETLQIGLANFEDNYYWLNELAEILNPYLSEE